MENQSTSHPNDFCNTNQIDQYKLRASVTSRKPLFTVTKNMTRQDGRCFVRIVKSPLATSLVQKTKKNPIAVYAVYAAYASPMLVVVLTVPTSPCLVNIQNVFNVELGSPIVFSHVVQGALFDFEQRARDVLGYRSEKQK